MAVPGLQCSVGFFSRCSEWLLVVVASLVAEQRLQGAHASVGAVPGPSRTSAVVGARRLSCSTACGILDQGSNPCLLHWQEDFSTEPQGNP